MLRSTIASTYKNSCSIATVIWAAVLASKTVNYLVYAILDFIVYPFDPELCFINVAARDGKVNPFWFLYQLLFFKLDYLWLEAQSSRMVEGLHEPEDHAYKVQTNMHHSPSEAVSDRLWADDSPFLQCSPYLLICLIQPRDECYKIYRWCKLHVLVEHRHFLAPYRAWIILSNVAVFLSSVR